MKDERYVIVSLTKLFLLLAVCHYCGSSDVSVNEKSTSNFERGTLLAVEVVSKNLIEIVLIKPHI